VNSDRFTSRVWLVVDVNERTQLAEPTINLVALENPDPIDAERFDREGRDNAPMQDRAPHRTFGELAGPR
jgi:hypothetical protein